MSFFLTKNCHRTTKSSSRCEIIWGFLSETQTLKTISEFWAVIELNPDRHFFSSLKSIRGNFTLPELIFLFLSLKIQNFCFSITFRFLLILDVVLVFFFSHFIMQGVCILSYFRFLFTIYMFFHQGWSFLFFVTNSLSFFFL